MKALFDPDKHHLAAWVGIYDIDRFSGSTPNPLYYAALCGFYDLVERLVISHPQLINTVGGNYDFPVLVALSKKHIRVAELLLQHGGKLDIRGEEGLTPLEKSMDSDWFKEDTASVVSFLLRHGADVNARGSDLSTPLHRATIYANFELVQLLLENGADTNSRDVEERTPLHMVQTEGEEGSQVARLLLERGANVNAQDEDGATPLLRAAYYGYACITPKGGQEFLKLHGVPKFF